MGLMSTVEEQWAQSFCPKYAHKHQVMLYFSRQNPVVSRSALRGSKITCDKLNY
jgi:hypothetical protein